MCVGLWIDSDLITTEKTPPIPNERKMFSITDCSVLNFVLPCKFPSLVAAAEDSNPIFWRFDKLTPPTLGRINLNHWSALKVVCCQSKSVQFFFWFLCFLFGYDDVLIYSKSFWSFNQIQIKFTLCSRVIFFGSFTLQFVLLSLECVFRCLCDFPLCSQYFSSENWIKNWNTNQQ